MKRLSKWISKVAARISSVWTSPPPDQLFSDALEVFRTELYRKSPERASELSRELSRLAASQEFQRSAVPFALRHRLYQEHVDKICADFIADIKSIILPHCDVILPTHISTLQTELQRLLSNRRDQAKHSDAAFAASIGRSDSTKSAQMPVESLFNGASSHSSELIDSIIKQANLQAEHKRIIERKQRRHEILKDLIKWGFTGGGIVYLGSMILRELGVLK